MKMIIREYWEKVSNKKQQGLKRFKIIKGEYELHSTVVYDSGHIGEFRERFKNNPNIIELDSNSFKEDLGTQFGIHSYQTISFEE